LNEGRAGSENQCILLKIVVDGGINDAVVVVVVIVIVLLVLFVC
jgi:hypothetical protein